jgi:hypothetical protein
LRIEVFREDVVYGTEVTKDLPLFITEAQNHISSQFAVDLKVPAETVGNAQVAIAGVDLVRKDLRTAYDGAAIRSIACDGLCEEIAERCHVQGNLV